VKSRIEKPAGGFHIKLFKIKNIKKNMKYNFFERKEVTLAFAIIALIFSFFFLDANFTGNIITNKLNPITPLSLVSLLLIVCSAVLIAYSVKKR
jgi:hypothetical protein